MKEIVKFHASRVHKMEKMLTILTIFILLAEYSNGAFKSGLFLQDKFTVGHPASTYMDDGHIFYLEMSKAPGSHQVLFGHYTKFIEKERIEEEDKELEAKAIPALVVPVLKEVLKQTKGSSPEGSTSLGGRSANKSMLSKLINPLIDPILNYVKLNITAEAKAGGKSSSKKGRTASLSKIISPLLELIMNFVKGNLTQGLSSSASGGVSKRSPSGGPHVAKKRGIHSKLPNPPVDPSTKFSKLNAKDGGMLEDKNKSSILLSKIINLTINSYADAETTGSATAEGSGSNFPRVINPIIDQINDLEEKDLKGKVKREGNSQTRGNMRLDMEESLLSKMIEPVINPFLSSIKQHLSEGAPQMEGRSFSSPDGKSMPLISATLNPIIQPLLSYVKLNLDYYLKIAASLTLSGRSKNTTEREKTCEVHNKRCSSEVPEKQLLCASECLTRGNEILIELNHIIAPFLEMFCMPLETVFQKMFHFAQNDFEQFRKYSVFLDVLGTVKRSFGEIAALASQSVMTNVIDLVKCNMMPLRLVTGQLDVALEGIQSLEPRTDTTLINRLCAKVDGLSSLVTLVDIFNRGPDLIDALLRGFSTVNLIAKYVPVALQAVFAATAGAIRFLTGTSCGLIYYAMKGEVPKCDQVGGSLVLVPGMPLPEGTQDLELRPECIGPAADHSKPPSRRKRSLITEYSSYEVVLNGMGDGAGVRYNPEASNSLGQRGNGERMMMRKKRSLRVRRRLKFG